MDDFYSNNNYKWYKYLPILYFHTFSPGNDRLGLKHMALINTRAFFL
jgi:hypothetical protein